MTVAEKTVTCSHCGGRGECGCELCGPARDGRPDMDFREEFDTGRQMEATCRICDGLGKTTSDGKVIEM